MSRYLYGDGVNIAEPRELNREVNETEPFTGTFNCQIIVTDVLTHDIVYEIIINIKSTKQRRWLLDVIIWAITHGKALKIYNLSDLNGRGPLNHD